MIKHKDGVNPNGSIKWRYELTEQELAAGFHAFMTGPIHGTFALSDGTEYDVGPEHIAVKAEHAHELAWTIHKAHHAAERFLDVPLPGDGSASAYKAWMEGSASVPGDERHQRDEHARAGGAPLDFTPLDHSGLDHSATPPAT